MDALEFLKERKRMCNSYDLCGGCPLEGSPCNYGPNAPEEAYERIIVAVEQWSKEHPRKTRQSMFLEQWPDVRVDENTGVLTLCPAVLSKACRERCPTTLTPEICADCRHEFWMQEIGD